MNTAAFRLFCGTKENGIVGDIMTTTRTITLEECARHDGSNHDGSAGSLWVVVDRYVLDLTAFVAHHPGSKKKIINKRRERGPDISSNLLDHFGHTVQTFREACRRYDADPTGAPVRLKFRETGDMEVLVIGKIAM